MEPGVCSAKICERAKRARRDYWGGRGQGRMGSGGRCASNVPEEDPVSDTEQPKAA